MLFQARHYKKVAEVISETFATIDRAEKIESSMSAEDITEVIVMQFVSLFKTDNDAFKSQLFIDKCFINRK